MVRPSRPPSELPTKYILSGFAAVSPLDQHHGGVAHFLVGGMRKVDEGLVVGGKQLRRFARSGFVTGVGAVGRKSLRQRRGAVEGCGRRQAEAGDQHAVESAAAILHRAAVPLQRQIELKADRRRLRIGRVDMALHAAELRVRGIDAGGGGRPASATVNGFASTSAAVSILIASLPAPDNAVHAAAASAPRPRSAAVATVGSAVWLHRNTAAIATYARDTANFVII